MVAVLFYTVNFIRDIRGYHQPLVICAQLATLAPLGALAALFVIYLSHRRVPGHYILAASCLCFCIGNVLMGVTSVSLSSLPLCLSDSFGCCILIRIPWRSPRSQTFWAMVFPAEIIIVFGPDLSFASGALIISNSVPRSMLGIGGGLMNLFVVPPSSLSLSLCVTSRRY